MEIQTREYRIDPASWRKVVVRIFILRFWIFLTVFLAGGVWMLTVDATFRTLGLIYIVFAIALPWLFAWHSVRTAMKSPVAMKPFAATFFAEEFHQQIEGETRTKWKYEDLYRVRSFREG